MGACWVPYSSVVSYDIHIHRNIKHLCPAALFLPHLLCAVTHPVAIWVAPYPPESPIYIIGIEERFNLILRDIDERLSRNLILLVAPSK